MYVPGPGEKDLTRISSAIRELAKGRSNAAGTVTLAAGAGTTTVDFPNCAAQSIPLLVPMSASAASAGPYVQSVTKGSFIIGHAVSAATDMLVGFECRG